MDDWVISRRVNESCKVRSLARRGLALAVAGPRASLAFEGSSVPCVNCTRAMLKEGGLIADGQT